MKQKLLSLFTVLILCFTFFTGCSDDSKGTTASGDNDKVTTTPTEAAAVPEANDTSSDADALPDSEVYVFLAASLANSMDEIKELYEASHPNVTLVYNSDSSGTLQTQIEEGAECDVFFSAAMKQISALDQGGYIEPDSIKNLLENIVVLIKPTGGETAVTGFENIFDAKNLALAGEDVPVGAYAREIFNSLGIWDKVEAMEINEGANVTAVLAAVSEASNEVGVVYATDANSVKNSVEIIAYAPDGSLQTPVLYPACLIKNPDADENQIMASKDFMEFLSSDEAMAVFEAYGFSAYTE